MQLNMVNAFISILHPFPQQVLLPYLAHPTGQTTADTGIVKVFAQSPFWLANKTKRRDRLGSTEWYRNERSPERPL